MLNMSNQNKTRLIQGTTKYKLVIASGLLGKIEFLCRRFTNTEWSGILFYKPEGSFEDETLVLTAVDLYLRDIGDAGSTEFDLTPEVTTYMIDNGLIGTQMGLIHSHHSMATFFSGTDTSTLLQEGMDRNHFLSLIVNNAGTYSAKITRRIHNVSETSYNYPSFEDTSVKGYSKSEETIVESFDLTISKESGDFPEMETLIKAIQEEKKAKIPVYNFPKPYHPTTREVSAGPMNMAQQSLPFTPAQEVRTDGDGIAMEDDEIDINSSKSLIAEPGCWPDKIPYGKVTYPKELVRKALSQLLLCTPVVLYKDFNPERFAERMETYYNKAFDRISNFYEFAGALLEYIFWNTESEQIQSMGASIEEENAILAHDLLVELEKLPDNEYLDHYKEILEAYIL